MIVFNDPISHIDTSFDKDFYDYCDNNWQSNSKVDLKNRYNSLINDSAIVDTLNQITSVVFECFIETLTTVYPKWKGNIISKRYQFSGNRMSSQPYKMRDWHLDKGNKAIIGLWYFKHPNDTDEAGLHISNGNNKKYIPYSENRCVLFPNLPNSWHKVGERSMWTHERRFINIILETDETLHDYKRLSGFDHINPVNNLMLN